MTARVQLTLYVAGTSGLSARAIHDTRRMCDLHLTGEYELAVLDLSAAGPDRVVAAPTLVRNRPLPELQLVGDLSDTHRVLVALDLERS
jgi:circadian clock protein KaiB